MKNRIPEPKTAEDLMVEQAIIEIDNCLRDLEEDIVQGLRKTEERRPDLSVFARSLLQYLQLQVAHIRDLTDRAQLLQSLPDLACRYLDTLRLERQHSKNQEEY